MMRGIILVILLLTGIASQGVAGGLFGGALFSSANSGASAVSDPLLLDAIQVDSATNKAGTGPLPCPNGILTSDQATFESPSMRDPLGVTRLVLSNNWDWKRGPSLTNVNDFVFRIGGTLVRSYVNMRIDGTLTAASDVEVLGDVLLEGALEVDTHVGTPDTPASGKAKVYIDPTTGNLLVLWDDGSTSTIATHP